MGLKLSCRWCSFSRLLDRFNGARTGFEAKDSGWMIHHLTTVEVVCSLSVFLTLLHVYFCSVYILTNWATRTNWATSEMAEKPRFRKGPDAWTVSMCACFVLAHPVSWMGGVFTLWPMEWSMLKLCPPCAPGELKGMHLIRKYSSQTANGELLHSQLFDIWLISNMSRSVIYWKGEKTQQPESKPCWNNVDSAQLLFCQCRLQHWSVIYIHPVIR